MGKSTDSKLRLLYLMRYLLRQTDEAHPAGIADMLTELARYGITANRKTVYDDLEALRTFGMDLVTAKSHVTGYYIASRDFELPELKLLVDSVQSSKFITQKKTLSLIRKIEGLTSVHEGQFLQRQVYVHNRVKTMNESVYYNVDEISGAIARARGIRFILDAAQTAGVLPLDMEGMCVDALAFTGHKGLLGPQGTGGFLVREEDMDKYTTAEALSTAVIVTQSGSVQEGFVKDQIPTYKEFKVVSSMTDGFLMVKEGKKYVM